MSVSTFSLPNGGGDLLQVLDDRVRVLADAVRTGAQYELFEVSGAQGSGPPPHCHPWDEAYYLLEGELDVVIAGETRRARPGDYVFAPGNGIHSFRIVGGPARFLVVTTGAGAGEFFRAMDREIGFPPPSLEAVCALAARHGVVLAG